MPPDGDMEFIIELLPGTAPIYKRPYRMSSLQLRELKDQIQELEGKGYICPSSSSWGALLFLSLRKMTHRECVLTIVLSMKSPSKHKYLLPRIDDLFDQLHGARVFSEIDLRFGYH
jgi:hypothetical protein